MLTQIRLKELMEYDPDTGFFTRLRGRGGEAAGGRVGGPDKDGYWMIAIDGVRYKAHRLAFLYMTGMFPNGDVDHINRVTGDNRWSNIREATRAQNMANIGTTKANKSGHRGVCWVEQKKRWKAQIRRNGKNHHIGYYKSAVDAANAYAVEAISVHGDFAHNVA